MAFWELESIKSVLGGTWLARADAAAVTEGVTTDSRAVRHGQCFIALRGEKFEGNAFVGQAAASGAVLAIIDRPEALPTPIPPAIGVLSVADTGLALLRLAAAYRRSLESTRVIGVTGSNGKTTATRLIEAVLSQTLRGTASVKSFNNRVGVPLTILSAKRGDQFLVCEVGTNAIGEIAELAAVIEPDIAVITSIGREHLEGLGSVAGSIAEATSLVAALRPGGVAIINDEPPELSAAVTTLAGAGKSKGFKILRFGRTADADLRITSVETDLDGVKFCLNGRQHYRLGLLGSHNALNGAAAVGVARRLSVAQEAIEAGLASARGAEMRLERVTLGGVEFINDAYNANPESMLAALRTLGELPRHQGRKVVVLGDMLELGAAGPDAHREIGDAVAASGAIDLAVFVGPLSMFGAERVRRAWAPERVVPVEPLNAERAAFVASLLKPGDRVLLKGSRGMGLERILGVLREGTDAPQVKVRGGASSLRAS